jgi:collagen type I/II/III/V/XI/XXIV/XXVII alpha
VGRRHIDCERHLAPVTVRPFRIAAHTFGRGMPERDLLLSPDHGVFVDGVLVPVKYLANGDTIRQRNVAEVTYYHFELRQHAIVEAEGLTVETLLPGSDRTAFAGGSAVTALHPDFTARNWEVQGCAPLILTGPRLQAIRQRIGSRAPAASTGPRQRVADGR